MNDSGSTRDQARQRSADPAPVPTAAVRPSNETGPLTDPWAIQRSIGEVAYHWDILSDVLVWGPNALEVLQVADPEMIATGRRFAQLTPAENPTVRFDAVLGSPLVDQGEGLPFQIEYCITPSADAKVWIEDTGRWFAGEDGRPAWAHGVVRIVTDRHVREERLAYLARHDSLTGEMNRRSLVEALQDALDEAMRYRSSCAFLIVGIDHLSRMNDCYGFEIADEAVAMLGKRLRAKMRGVDCLGRLSGNKFGVILKTASLEDMGTAADRFLGAIREDVIQTSRGPVALTVTIGGVLAPRHARTVDEILARAHDSLEQAKRKRPGSFLAYRPSVEREELRKTNIRASDEIIAALNQRRVLLAYEPVVATCSRQPVFYECLVRFSQDNGTLVNAGSIISTAERLGLVRLIDQRTLELVIAKLLAAPALNASLNVSPSSIIDPDWWAAFEARLRSHPEAARRLIVEITETTAIQDLVDTLGFVSRVKDIGCRIAIDDFGAGYTSFRNLRKLGVDMVKIDGTFVQNIVHSEDDRLFVRSMIELSHSLGLATVAEWVQDEETAALLAQWRCDYLQGRLMGEVSIEPPAKMAAQALAPVASA